MLSSGVNALTSLDIELPIAPNRLFLSKVVDYFQKSADYDTIIFFKNPAIDTIFALAQDAAKSEIAPNEAIAEIFDLTALAQDPAHLPEKQKTKFGYICSIK